MGFEVKSEIAGADVVACRDGEMLIVELKTAFSLTLLQQGVARQKLTELVYVAVPEPKGQAGAKALAANVALCRRLGLGVLTVTPRGGVALRADPGPYRPRLDPRRRDLMLGEFARRAGDPNRGGTRGTIETAYRQDARACAACLAEAGAQPGRRVAAATGVARATRIMADNHHGWFVRVRTGVYDLTEAGRAEVAGSGT